MQNKLQELTDKLYNEGLSKGKEAGEAILAKSKKEAEEMLENARKEAEKIKAQAQKEAEDFKTKVESDLRMASAQTLQATKKDLEDLVVCKVSDLEVSKTMSSADFIKEMITEVARKFNAEESMDLNLVLPEKLQKELEPFIKNELGKMLKGEVKASFTKKIAGGFTIGPKDGSYYISLTDETFKALISEYMRPTTKKLLFNE